MQTYLLTDEKKTCGRSSRLHNRRRALLGEETNGPKEMSAVPTRSDAMNRFEIVIRDKAEENKSHSRHFVRAPLRFKVESGQDCFYSKGS